MKSFFVLLLAYTLSQFYRSFLAVVSGDLVRDLKLDPAQLGTLSAAWFAAFAFAQFPIGYALDRWGPRGAITLGMAVAVLGASLLAGASGYATGLLAMALIGVGCAPIYMSSLYIIARERPDRFAFLSALILGLGSVGNLIGATPLVLAAEHFGWRVSILAIAAATAATTLAVWLVVRDPPRLSTSEGGGMIGGLAEVARIRALWLLLPLAFVSYAVVIATRAVWIAPFLSTSYGLAPEPLGNVVLAFAFAMSVGAIATGTAVRHLGAKVVTTLGNLVCVAGFLALGLGWATHVGSATAIFVAVGFFGITYAVLMEHGRQFMPPHLIGRGITLMNFAFIGGAGLLQYLAGHAVAGRLAEGIAAPDAYRQLFLGFAIVLAIPALLYLAAPSRPRHG